MLISIYYPYILESTDISNYINVHNPSVTYNNNEYLLWYAASDKTINRIHINYSKSDDGLNWQSSVQEVLKPDYPWESFGNKGISFPRVIINNNTYYIWYGAYGEYNGKVNWRIGHATSTDGINWTKYPEPVLEADQNWENTAGRFGLGNPNVIVENGIYHMWYHADRDIGHATSPDGIHWMKDPDNPVLSPSYNPNTFDYQRVGDPFVIKKDDIYYMFYTGLDNNGRWQIGLATSESIPTPIISPTPISATPSIAPSPSLTPNPTLTITPSITVTPTILPTVTMNPRNKPLVIVPGLGASWNPKAIFSCNLQNSGEWKLAPYAYYAYKPLMRTLSENAHLTQDKDFYLYSYDWRNDLQTQAIDFKKYIDDILSKKPEGTKINLIGHSYGGLVIRSYLNNYPGTDKVDKVITVGTPHKGSILAYPLWENGEVWMNDIFMSVSVNQVINHCRIVRTFISPSINIPKILSKKEIVHLLIPSIENLLPTYDYLKKERKIIDTFTLKNQNLWLKTHIFNKNGYPHTTFITLSGANTKTIRYLNTIDITSKYRQNTAWEDGKPTIKEYSQEGDGSVLTLSSELEGVQNDIIAGNHGDIISKKEAIKKILSYVGFDNVLSITEETSAPESDNNLVISIDHHAKLQLTTPNLDSIISDDDIIAINNPKQGVYRLKITPYTKGLAYIHIMQLTKNTEPEYNNYAMYFNPENPINFTFPYYSNQIRGLKLIPVN